jgi:hypothetical protein
MAVARCGDKVKFTLSVYSRKAQIVIPTLEDYERNLAAAENVVVPMATAAA